MTNVKQRDDEPSLDYREHFQKTYDEIEGLRQDSVLTCFEGELKSHALKKQFRLRRLQTLEQMFKTLKHVARLESFSNKGNE